MEKLTKNKFSVINNGAKSVEWNVCPWGYMSMVAKCPVASFPWGELSMGQNVPGASCPWGKMFLGQAVPGASCPWDKLSLGWVAYGAKCHRWISMGVVLSTGRVSMQKVVRESVTSWILLFLWCLGWVMCLEWVIFFGSDFLSVSWLELITSHQGPGYSVSSHSLCL